MINIKRIEKKFQPDSTRVIIKPHIPGDSSRIKNIITRVMRLSEDQVEKILERVIENFANRHKNIFESFDKNYNAVKKYVNEEQISKNRRALIGAYFSSEYSIQSAAFFNPSVIEHPNQDNVEDGCIRFIMSFRSVGEGHISSIEFRSGIIDKDCNFTFDEVSRFAEKAMVCNNESCNDYELKFMPQEDISEKVLFPASKNDSNGIEDARFVKFKDDNNEITYYATYTAYDGHSILPQIIETKDFSTFKIITLDGELSQNKGMALFPRKINGKYMMVSRVDGENLYIMSSDNIKTWKKAELLKQPENDWEFIQIGNCGSPVETEFGWVLLTHGVGPMREYSIGVILLDIANPLKIIGNMSTPLLTCNEEEREGYVPNVVYSCGCLTHNDNLIIPYAMSDTCSGIVTVKLSELFKNIQIENRKGQTEYANST